MNEPLTLNSKNIVEAFSEAYKALGEQARSYDVILDSRILLNEGQWNALEKAGVNMDNFILMQDIPLK